ncbi:MAG: efflux RND transporter permease subunit, partial [Phycisphaeraceae bacterium]
DARSEVSDSLREVSEYPQDVDEPVIATSEGAVESPIAWLIFTCDDPDFDVQSLGDPAEDRIKPVLERVEGVSEVRVYGGRERQVHIEFDPARLAHRGITFNQLRRNLQLQNVNISAGDLAEGQYDVRVRTVGQYEDLDQVRQTIVAYTAGGPVRIQDLAEVRQTFAKRRVFVRSKGDVALALPVYHETGANVIRVMQGLRERIEAINRNVLPVIAERVRIEQGLDEAPNLTLRQVYDETVYIYDALGLVRNNLFIGGSLAIAALLLFLRIVRPTLIVALAIPISVVGTFVALTAAGRSLNVISLAGLAFAVGMVVDNAIVVLENIDRHLGMGKKPVQAAYDATKEVWGAILASTLTTLAVFFPVIFMQEEAGQLFRDIALAIMAAVTLSLIVAVTVIPSASARWLRVRVEPKGLVRKFRHLWGLTGAADRVSSAYAGWIYRLTERSGFGVAVRVGVVAAFTLVSLIGAYLLMPPMDYLPRGNQNIVFGGLITPPGYNIEQDRFIAERIEAQLQPYWQAKSYDDLAGLPPVIHPFTGESIDNIPPIENYFFVSYFGGLFGGATSQDKQNVRPLGGLLTSVWNSIPGCVGFAEQRSLFGRGMGGTRSIEVEVVGTDLGRVGASAVALQDRLRARYTHPKVQPSPSNFDLAGPELRIEIDRVKAADLGIDVAALGLGVEALVDGMTIGEFYFHGEAIDILVVRGADQKLAPEDLATMPLAYVTRDGGRGTVPLSSVARMYRTLAPQQIRRVEELRAVTLTVTPPDEVPIEQASFDIEQIVTGLRNEDKIARDVEVNLAGSASKLSQVREALLGEWHGWNLQSLESLLRSRMFLALLVTYLLMAALFESFLYPLVIMFSVPLATVGGFAGLRLVHTLVPTQQLDVLTMLGFVILIGVVVNNAILIVHQALNFMRGLGDVETGVLSAREAIRESVRTRLRPVLMTTLTSVVGMLPLVLMPGSGSELYRGLGSVVIGGLVVATLFTLIVVPLVFSLVIDMRDAVVGGSAGAAGEAAAATA